LFPTSAAVGVPTVGAVKRRTEGSQDESGPQPTVIAKNPLGDHVSDIVTGPNDSIAHAALCDSIAVIGSDHEVSCDIPIGGNPRDLTIDADGSRLYATNYDGSISVIDIAGVCVIPGACRTRRVDTVDGALIYAAGNALDGCRCGGRISVIGAGGARIVAIPGFDGYVITDLAVDSESNRVYVGLSLQSAYY
jgi:DNA-binding beta-propeller fold protein YncE